MPEKPAEETEQPGDGKSVNKPKGPGKPKKRTNRKRASTKRAAAKADAGKRAKGRGGARLFPSVAFQDALTIANTIHKVGAGKKMRRLTAFDELQKSPDSGHSRQLVTNSSKYGLTSGGYQGEYLELTELGRVATDPEANGREKLRAQFSLAIGGIELFNYLYEKLVGGKLPATSVIQDMLRDKGVPQEHLGECVDIFVVNAKFLGLLRTIAGAERIISVEHALEDFSEEDRSAQERGSVPASPKNNSSQNGSTGEWSRTCFYIAPIGEESSDQRKHSDLFLNYIIEPALEKSGLNIVRADQISKAGMITSQVIEHILRSRLVIADLSFHNPNVFYELSLRHTCGLPTVQVIRSEDKIPFDLQQYRTIEIDNATIYTLVPKLEIYRSQVATQVRAALEDSDASDNPIRLYFPDLSVTIPPVRNQSKG